MPLQESACKPENVSNEDAIACWERAAGEFAAFFAEGPEFWHAHVINPCLLDLLGDVRGKAVLDLACGEGHLARELVARAGDDVEIHGVDASQTMIRIAREKSAGVAGRLAFHIADAAALTTFPPACFDVAVCNMALMDIKDYRGAIAEVARTLKQGGIFVFSLLHPCIFTPGSGWLTDDDGTITGWRVDGYTARCVTKGRVKRGMTFQTYNFHRPLEDYAGALADHGFAITAMREPAPSDDLVAANPRLAHDLPQGSFLVVRCARLG